MEVCKGDRSAFSPPKDRLVSCLLYKEGSKGSGGKVVRGEDTFRPSQVYTSLLLLPEKKKRSTSIFGGHMTYIISAQNSRIPGVSGNSSVPFPFLRLPTVFTFFFPR